MSKIAERVRRLVALAGSDNVHEARNAAMTACRLIREHGLEVREARAHAAPSHGSTGTRRHWWASEPEPPRRAHPEPRVRRTRGPYSRVWHASAACAECGDPVSEGEGVRGADGRVAHGDCVPAAERP